MPIAFSRMTGPAAATEPRSPRVRRGVAVALAFVGAASAAALMMVATRGVGRPAAEPPVADREPTRPYGEARTIPRNSLAPRATAKQETAAARPRDREESKRRFEQTWREKLAQHARLPRNAGWAAETEAALTKLLDGYGLQQEFTIASLDCRTTTCLASLQFADYEEATDRYQSLAGILTEGNNPCPEGASVYLPEPEDPSRPYRVNMLLTCAR